MIPNHLCLLWFTNLFVCFLFACVCLCLFFVFACVGSTLTPLTPIPVSDVGKSMLPSPSLSVLGDQQFQTGLFIHYQWRSFIIILFIIHWFILFFIAVGSGSISTVIPPTDYYNSASSYPQYSSPYGGYSYGTSGSLLTKWGTYKILFIIVRNLDFKKSNLAQYGPIWTNLDYFGLFWTT